MRFETAEEGERALNRFGTMLVQVQDSEGGHGFNAMHKYYRQLERASRFRWAGTMGGGVDGLQPTCRAFTYL